MIPSARALQAHSADSPYKGGEQCALPLASRFHVGAAAAHPSSLSSSSPASRARRIETTATIEAPRHDDTDIVCSELGGKTIACAQRADCESIINQAGAQVCVDA